MPWYKVAERDELDEGTARAVDAGDTRIALTRFDGRYGALDNRCPHMGGPLGDGDIEYGLLICPWHGREYHPHSGQCENYDEHVASFEVEEREDGIYVRVE